MLRTKTKSTGAVKIAMMAAVTLLALTAGGCIDDAYADDGGRRGGIPVHAGGPYVPGTKLMSTTWDQYSPYNNMTPVINGKRDRIGCASTAMIQVIRYHEWPQNISANIPGYTTNTLQIAVPEIVRQNFNYDWANMKDAYVLVGPTATIQGDSADAVALLAYHYNVAVGMDFGAEMASRHLFQWWQPLPANFDYDENLRYICRDGWYVRPEGWGARDSILPHIWDDVLRLQIDSLRPMFYGGGPTYNDFNWPYHLFVVDGYNDKGEFHMNFGFSGRHYGWYPTTAANPPNWNFSNSQIAYVNVMPNRRGRGTPTMKIFGRNLRARKLSGNYGGQVSVNNGELFFVNPTIYNIGTASSPAGRILGVALYTSANQFTIIGETALDETLTFTRAREPVSGPWLKRDDFNLEIRASVPSNIRAGNYTLRAVMKNDNGEWEPVGTVSTIANSYANEMTISVTGVNDDGSGFSEALNMEMIFVAGGTFTMGCTSEQGGDCATNERPAHSVTLGGFHIGKYEVTQSQWRLVTGDNPSRVQGDNLPVTNVSWNEIQAFITRLNGLTGRRYRLPTEAEWEFAARGGNQSRGYKYSGGDNLDEVAWHKGNSNNTVQPVGTKRPNELGIYDMSGNVYEWVNDWWRVYTNNAETNPAGPSSGTHRIWRGGDWWHDADRVRVSHRSGAEPNFNTSNIIGFRLALEP